MEETKTAVILPGADGSLVPGAKVQERANGARMTRLKLRKPRCSLMETEIGKWVKCETLLPGKG